MTPGALRSQAAQAVGKLLGRRVPPRNPGGVAGGPDRPLVPVGFAVRQRSSHGKIFSVVIRSSVALLPGR